MKYRITKEIFQKKWEIVNFDTAVNYPPPSEPWNKQERPNISDIEIWEQLYYQPGSIGIYAAWHPRYEFYMLVHDLFKNNEKTVEQFWGPGAAYDVYKKAQKLGIDLEIYKIEVSDEEKKNYIDF